MERELAVYIELVERRIAMLRRLCQAIEQCQNAVVALDLDGIYQGTLQQETLCAEIHSLDRELETAEQLAREVAEGVSSTPTGRSSGLDPETTGHLRLLGRELAETQERVRHLNRVQAGLLRRSRRSAAVLLNFISNYSGTYQTCGLRAVQALPLAAGG